MSAEHKAALAVSPFLATAESRYAAYATPLVDVATVARYLSVGEDYVYRHAAELGGRKLGAGPKARWRFSLPELDEQLRAQAKASSCSASRLPDEVAGSAVMPVRRRRRRRGLGTGSPVVPLPGSSSGRDGAA